MPTNFPCPNTQCSYQFDADILPAAAMVTCPLCRTRFPYRANRPVPATAGVEPGDDPRPTGPRLIHLREVPKGGGVLTTLLWVGGFCVVLACVLVVVIKRGGPQSQTSTDVTSEPFNLRVDPFPAGWAEDLSARRPVEANILGRKRASPDGWVAVAAKDWVDRQPRAGELSDFMHRPLRAALSTPFFQPIEGETWAGHPATAVQFAGNLDDVQVRGEAYAISYKGISYVFYAWTADADWEAQRAGLVSLREKIRPANFRDKWTERRINTVVFSPDDAGYQVEDPDGVWVRGKPSDEWKDKDKVKYPVDDVKALDPAATMALMARYQPKERGDALRRQIDAMALVVELPKSPDPLEAAKAHALEHIKRSYGKDVPAGLRLEELTKSRSGVALPTGGPPIGRFRVEHPGDRSNPDLWVISVIEVGDKIVAVEAHVAEKDASYVEEWMVHLAGSLKAK